MKGMDDLLKTSFGEIGETYDRVRPDYPAQTIEDIIRITGIDNHKNILEIGCGTGRATLPFATKVFKVTALDISENLIHIAKKNLADYSNVQFITGSFEENTFKPGIFDLIFCAQTFHWLDEKKRYKLIHKLLKHNGHLVIFSNFQDRTRSDIEKAVFDLYERFCPNPPGVDYGSLQKFKDEIHASGLFTDIQEKNYYREISYSLNDYIDLQKTFSSVSTLHEKTKKLFFTALKTLLQGLKKIIIPWKTIMLVAKKKTL